MKPKIEEVLKVAPEIADIREEAKRTLRRSAGADFWETYEHLKRKLNRSVGFFCVYDYPEWMCGLEAHDTAYHFVFEGLT